MATTQHTRSRSPVMSIRTQPEEDRNLIAEMKAASRTQHEIVPRYSWPSTFSRRREDHPLKCNYPPVLRRDLPPSRLATSSTVDEDCEITTSTFDRAHHNKQSRPLLSKSIRPTRRPWKKYTERNVKSNLVHPLPPTSFDHGTRKLDYRTGAGATGYHDRRDEVSTTAGEDAYIAGQGNSVEEENIIDDLPTSAQVKPKGTVRRSICGSLSSTKSFLKNISKTSRSSVSDGHTLNQSPIPHLDDFETKRHLAEWLDRNVAVSPLTPTRPPRAIGSPFEAGPAELSAIPDPGPAELEGNKPKISPYSNLTISCASTPSLRELPPYVDDKKFRTDMAKDSSLHAGIQDGDLVDCSGAFYTCTSCQKPVAGHEVYDFCAVCDHGSRVFCHACAQRGPCCQHELEVMLRNMSLDAALPSDALTEAGAGPSSLPQKQEDCRALSCGPRDLGRPSSARAPEVRHVPAADEQRKPNTDITNLHLEFVKEMSAMRREQDFSHRERELVLRARELELRDQYTTLRERQALAQQKSDIMTRNLETLVSYQDLARSALKGFSVEAVQHGQDPDIPTAKVHSSTTQLDIAISSPEAKIEPSIASAAITNKASADAAFRPKFQKIPAPHVRSHAPQKRKKAKSAGSAAQNSPPVTTPQQHQKSPSRGNSERNASQDEDEEDDGDNERRRSNKRSKGDPSTPNGSNVLFACPYYKHDPVRFSSRNTTEKNYRGCDGHFLTDVSRLKQHLKRVHWQPETYCPRCYAEFENSTSLLAHAGAPLACIARNCPFPEKMNKTKQGEIHVKRPRVPAETVWYDIFKVLFPGSPLPESPYVQREDSIVTPTSTTPLPALNDQAKQQFHTIFKNHLDQYAELQDNRLKPLIQQAFADSLSELLNAFSLSPTASPAAAPSIVVSPVSRSSSGNTHTSTYSTDHGPQSVTQSDEAELLAVNIISRPQTVPLLQQPKPPNLHGRTALQVPLDYHCASVNQDVTMSAQAQAPIDCMFNVNIPIHVQQDRGYDDECRSYEQGDDQQAMEFIGKTTIPPWRNKSVMSIDSGYGSGRSQQHPNLDVMNLKSTEQRPPLGHDAPEQDRYVAPMVFPPHDQQSSYPQCSTTTDFNYSTTKTPPSHDDRRFHSYSNYLHPSLRYTFEETNFPCLEANNPWCSG